MVIVVMNFEFSFTYCKKKVNKFFIHTEILCSVFYHEWK